MAKANINLPDGTKVMIEGTPKEVHKLLELYSGIKISENAGMGDDYKVLKKKKQKVAKKGQPAEQAHDYLTKIINLIKECDEADAIEKNIIDKASQVNKVLLPLYIVHEHMENSFGLQSGEISKITKDLGIPISQPNVSRTLSNSAARYVMGDRVRKIGQAVKYRLNRRGIKYVQGVVKGE